MEKYLEKEKFLLEQTNYMFIDKNTFNWYSLKDNIITEHSHLINAMFHNPEYLIFKRGDSENKVIIYYDSSLQIVGYLPFNGWKLYDPVKTFKTSSYITFKSYNLEDPIGVMKRVDLTDFIPYLPLHLKDYISCKSFVEFDLKAKLAQQG